jgi:hypothetical protein
MKRRSDPIFSAGLGLACVIFTFTAQAAPAPDKFDSPVGTKSSETRPSSGGAQPGVGSKDSNLTPATPRRISATPQRGLAQGSGAGAKRLHSPLQARGPVAHPPVHTQGSIRAANSGQRARGANGLGAANSPKLAALKASALPAPKLTAIPRNSAIGGPRAQIGGRIGGAAISGTNHNAIINGTEFRRK